MKSARFHPAKLYYKIGEVCGLLEVEPHVLRYWESEFPGLKPPKNKAGQRTYRPRDIELLLRIRRLLYEEGYTIAGARKQLAAARAEGVAEPEPEGKPPDPAKTRKAPSQQLRKVRHELENILTLLDRE